MEFRKTMEKSIKEFDSYFNSLQKAHQKLLQYHQNPASDKNVPNPTLPHITQTTIQFLESLHSIAKTYELAIEKALQTVKKNEQKQSAPPTTQLSLLQTRTSMDSTATPNLLSSSPPVFTIPFKELSNSEKMIRIAMSR